MLNYENKKLKEDEIKIKDKEIEELKQKLIDMERTKNQEIEKLEMKAQIYKEMSEKGKNVNQGIIINNTNTNNLNYVNKHFKDAPPLEKISNYIINGIDLDDDTQIDKLTENIIYSYNNKCLHKLIGDHIIKNYKKDDINLQSFHATDVARRKFLVKLEDSLGYLYDDSSDEIDNYNPDNNSDDNSDGSINEDEYIDDNDNDSDEYNQMEKKYKNSKILIKKNKSKWTNDNEGVKISYLLFEPVIKKIIRQLKKKCKEYNRELKKNIKKVPTKDEAMRFEILANLLKEMDTNKLKKNINNYIAPYFGLAKNQ